MFQILSTNTPFLLCIKDMDNLNVKLDNIMNVLVKGNGETVPIVRKWGHPWMLLHHPPGKTLAWCHLTEPQLRRLHRRFGHLSARRLIDILRKAGHGDFQPQLVKHLTQICHHFQMNAKAPGRFKFTIKDEIEFNHEIVMVKLQSSAKLQQFNVRANESCLQSLPHCLLWAFIFG